MQVLHAFAVVAEVAAGAVQVEQHRRVGVGLREPAGMQPHRGAGVACGEFDPAVVCVAGRAGVRRGAARRLEDPLALRRLQAGIAERGVQRGQGAAQQRARQRRSGGGKAQGQGSHGADHGGSGA
jgi:hypothetical protein